MIPVRYAKQCQEGGDVEGHAGRRVLEKFIARVRRQGAQPHIEQPDGNHGRVIARGR
jgi:hypothetical protein